MPISSDLSCQELVELVTEYLEGALSPGELARFERHLDICPGCQTYFDQIRQTIRATGELVEESLEPETRERLLDLFRNWKRGQ